MQLGRGSVDVHPKVLLANLDSVLIDENHALADGRFETSPCAVNDDRRRALMTNEEEPFVQRHDHLAGNRVMVAKHRPAARIERETVATARLRDTANELFGVRGGIESFDADGERARHDS